MKVLEMLLRRHAADANVVLVGGKNSLGFVHSLLAGWPVYGTIYPVHQSLEES